IRRSPFPAVFAGLLFALATGAVPLPVAHAGTAPQDTDEAAAKQKLDAVKAKIAALAKAQRQTGAQRNQLNAALSAQADRLAAASRAVHGTATAIAAKQRQLHQLGDERDALGQRLDSQRAALADLLRAAYALGRGSDLRLLLGDEDVARMARALAYSKYFQRDRVTRIRSLLGDLARLDEVKAALVRERQALEDKRGELAQQAEALARQRTRQQQLLAQADAQLQDQHRRLAALRQDQQALNRLLEKLRDVFADIPEAMPADTPFARLRGSLPWPAKGTLHDSGDGVRIAASRGSEVRAVAHGRVAYADWLRGYGMLVIIDHGNGWMSLYGDNEAVLRGVGDWVDAGDAVGTAGATAGDDAGIYFELRHDGKPVDPRPWLAKRR
ncbi:MAG TPA: peptidoglycan DD-metalloendopeptidase family protein, partial [Rhodanobacteraceae bacterium]|nr:peptidoglycan DD-metalloendopeptidase family protein [Rhodanobacteraceae bacterium]